MVKELRTVPFDEFAGNVTAFFKRVIDNHETVLIEKDKGELVMLRPARKRRSIKSRTQTDQESFLSTAGGWKDLVDTDKLVEDIYESRSVISRPPITL